MDLAVELANTTSARRGEVHDALATTADLIAWLRRAGPALIVPLKTTDLAAVTMADVQHARRLRDAIRGVAGAASARRVALAADVADLNASLRTAPTWWELGGTRRLRREPRHFGTPVGAALAQAAANAVDLLVDDRVRACGAPGCIQFFVRDNPRREWCSDGCGNRVRAARHYDRTRRLRTT